MTGGGDALAPSRVLRRVVEIEGDAWIRDSIDCEVACLPRGEMRGVAAGSETEGQAPQPFRAVSNLRFIAWLQSSFVGTIVTMHVFRRTRRRIEIMVNRQL